MSAPNKYPVRLTAEQRERLEALTRQGGASARKVRQARVLLLSDRDRPEGHWTDPRIGEALGMHVNSVAKVRKRFVLEGEQPALRRKPRDTPPVAAKVDGRLEAHLVAICCGPAPSGRVHWTMELLATELVRRGLITQISRETVRLILKKTRCSLGASSRGACPNGTPPASWPRWRKSSISMRRRTATRSR